MPCQLCTEPMPTDSCTKHNQHPAPRSTGERNLLHPAATQLHRAVEPKPAGPKQAQQQAAHWKIHTEPPSDHLYAAAPLLHPTQHSTQQHPAPPSPVQQHHAALGGITQLKSKRTSTTVPITRQPKPSTHAQAHQSPWMSFRKTNRPSVLWPGLCLMVLLSMGAPREADTQGTCPVSIDYAVSLGQGGGDNSNVPIFVASLGITNHANVSL